MLCNPHVFQPSCILTLMLFNPHVCQPSMLICFAKKQWHPAHHPALDWSSITSCRYSRCFSTLMLSNPHAFQPSCFQPSCFPTLMFSTCDTLTLIRFFGLTKKCLLDKSIIVMLVGSQKTRRCNNSTTMPSNNSSFFPSSHDHDHRIVFDGEIQNFLMMAQVINMERLLITNSVSMIRSITP